MILFAAGRGEAIRRFLVDDGAAQTLGSGNWLNPFQPSTPPAPTKSAGSTACWPERKGWGCERNATSTSPNLVGSVLEQVQNRDDAAQLKEASLAANLKEWTRLTTKAVVRCCESSGWEATARGHRLERLPELASEYLSLDAMAFPANRNDSNSRWPFPLAVFELENSSRNDRVGLFPLESALCSCAATNGFCLSRRLATGT